MGVKEPGAPFVSYKEVMKEVEEKMKTEQKKLYNKSNPFTINPPYNHHAKAHMAFAPFYPEMNQVGYNHKVHGSEVIPDYRVYNTERTASYNPALKKHLEKLNEKGLKDPWTRNDIWRLDPYAGYKSTAHNAWCLYRPGILVGAALAIAHFIFKTGYDHFNPAEPHKVDKWWELRETPEPNEIHNRIKPIQYRYGFIQVCKDPRLERPVSEDYGVVQPPIRQWYKKENDPALVGML